VLKPEPLGGRRSRSQTSHAPLGKRRIGGTPVGCSGRIAVNNSVMQPVPGKWFGKHVPAATNVHVTMRLLMEIVFSTRSVQRGYKEDKWDDPVS
jgi:hypothetical protein